MSLPGDAVTLNIASIELEQPVGARISATLSDALATLNLVWRPRTVALMPLASGGSSTRKESPIMLRSDG